MVQVPQTKLGRTAIDPFNRHVLRFVKHRAAERVACLDEILRHFGLAVDRHARAMGPKVDRGALPGRADLHTLVHEPIAIHARADAGAP